MDFMTAILYQSGLSNASEMLDFKNKKITPYKDVILLLL